MDFNASEAFHAWATGFSGCDGGNINAPIWFCGIEYGEGEKENRFSFEDVSEPKYVPADELPKHLGYQYNRKMAKIYAAICGRRADEYLENATERKLMSRNGDIFKMNLFPIAFRKDDNELWERWIFERTGIPTKSMYRAWCQYHRFTSIREWVRRYNPRLIIATSAYYQSDFIMAFDGVDSLFNKNIPDPEPILDRKLTWILINDNKTILGITPFLGYRYGLNSDALQEAFGKKLDGICRQHFGSGWLNQQRDDSNSK